MAICAPIVVVRFRLLLRLVDVLLLPDQMLFPIDGTICSLHFSDDARCIHRRNIGHAGYVVCSVDHLELWGFVFVSGASRPDLFIRSDVSVQWRDCRFCLLYERFQRLFPPVNILYGFPDYIKAVERFVVVSGTHVY